MISTGEIYGEAANPYGRAFAIGAVAGMRSTLAPAAVHLEARDRTTLLLALAVVGEMIGDKLPFTPSRVSPAPLAARVISGAYGGRALALRFGGNAVAGIVAGAAGAALSSFLGFATRKTIVEIARIPDAIVALAEDALAITCAVNAQRRPPDLTL